MPAMNNEEKYNKAKRLVELIGIGRSYIGGARKESPPESPRGTHEEFLVELQVKLRAKHMSNEQLDALLDFYSSDMGRSILEAQERIRKETGVTLASLTNNSGSKAAGWVPDPSNNSDDDT